MTFKELRAKHKKELKRSKEIDRATEKTARERAKVKKKICSKIHCLDCPFLRTNKCRDFVNDGDFSHLWDWYKGKGERTT